ncbi:plasmid stabilization protein [soil metagenome]
MPRGDKSAYTDKQKRKAEHIEEGYEDRGLSKDEAARRAWATVNKDSGGGNKSGSGRGKPDTNASARKGETTVSSRSAAARKGGETRRKNSTG